MNNLKFTGFTATDFNFLMLLCSKMRDKDVTELTISFDELRLKTGYTQHPVTVTQRSPRTIICAESFL